VLRPAPEPGRLQMHNANALKIGLFGANCSCGRAVTTIAIRNCDAFFTNVMGLSLDQQSEAVRAAKAEARAYDRELDVFTVGVITCRPTQKDAEDYHHYTVVEQADWSAVDKLLAIRGVRAEEMPAEEFQRQRMHFAHGNSGLPIIGDPDHVAGELVALSRAGLTGIAVSLVNFADELPYLRAEVLPRLARAGLRAAA